MKEGNLFVYFVCHFEVSQLIAPLTMFFSIVGTPSMDRGAVSCFHIVSTYNGEVIEY
jgi:hypothetical protein